jgi:hypothetical protein
VEVRWPVRHNKLRALIKVPYKVPCCLVSGEDRYQKNLLVKPPL